MRNILWSTHGAEEGRPGGDKIDSSRKEVTSEYGKGGRSHDTALCIQLTNADDASVSYLIIYIYLYSRYTF
jgi:hypothetical protein